LCAVYQRRKLRSRGFGMAWVNADECGEATVGPGDDTLLADDIDESSEQFRDQFGCSTLLVLVSITPTISALSSGSFDHAHHWRPEPSSSSPNC
jgi:hypothetical protein